MIRWMFLLMFPLGLLTSVVLQCLMLAVFTFEPLVLGMQTRWPGIARYFLFLLVPVFLLVLAPILAVSMATPEPKLKTAIRWKVMWPCLTWLTVISVVSFGISIWLNRTSFEILGDWQGGFVPFFASYWLSIRGAIRMGNLLALWTHDPNRSVQCVQCGYDLRGQKQCHCPECGAEYTVGQLVSGFRDL